MAMRALRDFALVHTWTKGNPYRSSVLSMAGDGNSATTNAGDRHFNSPVTSVPTPPDVSVHSILANSQPFLISTEAIAPSSTLA